jgi:hypothetical protein
VTAFQFPTKKVVQAQAFANGQQLGKQGGRFEPMGKTVDLS